MSESDWYKDAVLYELHVRSFADSGARGTGDFKGLTAKLDYLQDLGVTVVWLLPFYPSPLRDDGYDISDYFDVHPTYGTLNDFKVFLREAHRRGLRVITELVLNHTSDRHPWFQRARRAPPGSRDRRFYVWSDTPDRYGDARIIFKDFETSNWTYDPVAKAYYWHRFYSHQPDLNFENPETRRAMIKVMDFWFRLGVDGMRLDAVPYLFEREGTSCENLPETHAFLRDLRRHIDARFPGRMLLAEANQWPEEAVTFFGQGDECHMAFHFPIMPRMFMAIHQEDRFPILDILQQTPSIPESAQWALFLRNHDELTLETVTDEERDYMYRVYANDPQARINLGIRRRLAPLLGNNRRKIELMNGLLLSLPGTPVVYYGDEIGMGDNIYVGDRNGVRTPMQWSADKNAGFSRANPQRLFLPITIDPEYHYEAVNVEAQQDNPHSLLWWMRRIIALRKRYKAFGRGSIEFVPVENRKILAFIRRHGEEAVLVVANLSRFVQYAPLGLAPWAGWVPVELFSGSAFPPVGDAPYFLTLGPHAFYWFQLKPVRTETVRRVRAPVPVVEMKEGWPQAFAGPGRAPLEERLAAHLPDQPWFTERGRKVKSLHIDDLIWIADGVPAGWLAVTTVDFTEGSPATYLLPMALSRGDAAQKILDASPDAAIALLRTGAEQVLLHDGLIDRHFCTALLEVLARRRRLRGWQGELAATTTRVFRDLRPATDGTLEPSLLKRAQSNSSVVYGDRLILKLYRRLDAGINPDLEIGTFLTEKVVFPHTPDVAGYLEYRPLGGEARTAAVLQAFVPNEGDAWEYTLDELERYFERVLTTHAAAGQPPPYARPLLEIVREAPPSAVPETIGAYLESARLLGRRTAEMHMALAVASDDPAFQPEPFTPSYLRAFFQAMRSQALQTLQRLKKVRDTLPEEARTRAERVLPLEERMLASFRALLGRKFTGRRIRVHGDYHLGQVLYTGRDFVMIDFEGDPSRPISERRIKRSALRDVASMLRSFHYAAAAALREERRKGVVVPERFPLLEAWSRFWCQWVSSAFFRAYLDRAEGADLVPQDPEELAPLLQVIQLSRALHELDHELEFRPDWVEIPLEGILSLMEPLRTPEPG